MPPEWTGLNWRARPAHAWTCSVRFKADRKYFTRVNGGTGHVHGLPHGNQ